MSDLKNNNESMDQFLRKNFPQAPLPPPSERVRIWQAIEAQKNSEFSWLKSLEFMKLRWILPAGIAATLVFSLALHQNHKAREEKINQVLSSAFTYDLDADGAVESFF